ncbi:MAG: primase protein [Parcubacteria group bacterium GW2011_GWF2_44_8b]|nr:MAG: primase protein [Parcubacteria group bacterium GW2011_GWC1_43_30]KKT79821.1 MAG: primase protein [Parcubacteria group bacterium GW2011_GWF2_44_8b]
MRGDVDTIKERLDIAEIISGYVKLEKAGTSFKARCPFHNEKTPSFFVSPARQSFYCFGCGAKGDVFTFIEEVEGLDFRGALKLLAEKAGVEISYRGDESKTEKDKILNALEEATKFFEKELAENDVAHHYIAGRGISEETIKNWRIGYAPAEWRSLSDHLKNLGYDREIIFKAGLVKKPLDEARGKEPYDVFRDRIMFPLADSNGSIIAFSGRALAKETEPKYLNSPDTILFTKSEILYGLDKAKDQIRKQDYAVLVEGQIDLVLSHQSGIKNSVASSGTAITGAHLERLKRFSSRIIMAFDGDSAGEKAVEKASGLGISLGLEVKVANLPEGLDPAEVVRQNPEEWKDLLRKSLPAVEFFFNKIEEREKDSRKLGKQIEKRILPMIKLIGSAIEQSHFISMLAKRTGIKEEILWEDLKKVKNSKLEVGLFREKTEVESAGKTQRERMEERLAEIKLWQKELPKSVPEVAVLKKEEIELMDNLSGLLLHDNLSQLLSKLSLAEVSKDKKSIVSLTLMIQKVHGQMRALEEKKKIL